MVDKICFSPEKAFTKNVVVEKRCRFRNVNGNAGAAHCVYIPIDSSYGYFEFFSQSSGAVACPLSNK